MAVKIDGLKIVVFIDGKPETVFEAHEKDYNTFYFEYNVKRPFKDETVFSPVTAPEHIRVPSGIFEFILRFTGISKEQLKIAHDMMNKKFEKMINVIK